MSGQFFIHDRDQVDECHVSVHIVDHYDSEGNWQQVKVCPRGGSSESRAQLAAMMHHLFDQDRHKRKSRHPLAMMNTRDVVYLCEAAARQGWGLLHEDPRWEIVVPLVFDRSHIPMSIVKREHQLDELVDMAELLDTTPRQLCTQEES